jgi:cell division septation protein DedD
MRGGRELGPEVEVHLDNRKIFLLAFTVLVLVVLAFAVGYVVGRRSGWVTAGDAKVSMVTPPALQATPTVFVPTPSLSLAADSVATPALPDIPAIPAAAPATPTATYAPSATPVKEKSPTPAPAGARKGWSVQVGAYGEKTQATAAAETFRQKGRSAFVVDPSKGEARRLWRVRVGPFATKSAAEGAAASLRKEGVKEPLVREE